MLKPIPLLTLLIISAPMALSCQEVPKAEVKVLDREAKAKVVEAISKALIDEYVFLEVAEKCATEIRTKLDAGTFDGITEKTAFANALTDALQAISKDKHLRVRERRAAPQGAEAAPPNPGMQNFLQKQAFAARNNGFSKVEILEGNIGYVEIQGWAPAASARETASATLKFLSQVDALIVDERHNGGGSPDGIQYFTSFFFDKPTHLNSLYYRKANLTHDFWTLEQVDGKKLVDVPLFVLTSNYTFSGGEEFAYNLKTRKRATLVGEVTGGGANPGDIRPLPMGLAIFLPGGRAINPITKTNWEGVGVQPDIAVKAEAALDVALEKAKAAAKEYRRAREQRARELVARSDEQLAQAQQLLAAGKPQEGIALLRTALKNCVEADVHDEGSLNELGSQFLQAGKADMAIAVMAFNTAQYPNSANTWDSLGEAYAAKGDPANAILNYEKALKIDPKFPSALKALAALKK
jgi:tetratricopeptide (TPR) repeat protein